MPSAPLIYLAPAAPVWQCAWCSRWYSEKREYVPAPTDGRVPSHGICPPCLAVQLTKAKAHVVVPAIALNQKQAMKALGIGRTKFWTLCNLDDSDPRKIRRTEFGTFLVKQIEQAAEAAV